MMTAIGHPPRPRHLSITTGLAAGVVGCVLATAVLVHLPWSVTARGSVDALTGRVNAAVVDAVNGRSVGLLASAAVALRTLAGSLEDGVVDPGDPARVHSLFASVLKGLPTLSSVAFVWPDDRGVTARRRGDRAIEIETTTPLAQGDGVRRRVEGYGPGAPDAVVGVDGPAALPTRAFWYRQAEGEPSWSDVHPLPGGAGSGVTASMTVRLPGGPTGVLAVSLELERISAFLRGVQASPHGTVFLTNGFGELVAVPEGPPERLAGDGSAGIGKLPGAASPLVRAAAAAIEAHGVDLAALTSARTLAHRVDGGTILVTLTPVGEMGLVTALVAPETDIIGDIDANIRFLTIAVAVFLVVVAAAAALLAHRVLAVPLARVTDGARRLGAFQFEPLRLPPSRLAEIDTLSRTLDKVGASLGSFQKYVPTEVVRTLFAQGIEAELGGETRDLSILFMDLVDFTRLSEALGEEMIPLLAEYLGEMSATLRDGRATIDKYIGDAVMAFWGAPAATARHAELACRAALDCQRRLAELRLQRGPAAPPLRARIGINSGRALVGNVGSRDRLNYTAIGDTVNVASRLEALNKLYGTDILIGENTYHAARHAVVARRLDRVAVYGKAQGVAVYELLATAEVADDGMRAWVARFEQGLDAVAAGDWDGAEACFAEVLGLRGGYDRPAELYMERISVWRRRPPGAGMPGLTVLTEK